MPLDPDKLRRDVQARRVARGQGSGSGAMAAIREHLAAIEELRDDGASWPDIAAALTAQGILRGDGGSLTGRHLTALIASIRRQDERRAAAQTRRAVRSGLRHAFSATSAAALSQQAPHISGADVESSPGELVRGSPDALFRRLDQKAQQAAEADAERPDFSRGLLR